MHAAPPIPEPAASGQQCPKVIEQPAATPLRECVLWNRVGRFLQGVNASREIADEEILQHAQDCTTLMERAYQRFEDFHNPADRDEAVLWMTRRDEALRILSRRGHTFVELGR